MKSYDKDDIFSFKKHKAYLSVLSPFGSQRLIVLITLIASLSSGALAYLGIILFAGDSLQIFFVLKMAFFIPIIITPLIVWNRAKVNQKIYQLQKELYMSATYDMLTGFLSRPAFFSNLRTVYELAMRNGDTLSLASIDIDDFKSINDKYGHAAGDEVLRHFNKVINNSLRKSDFIGRVGGDEFILALPNTSLVDATQVSEKIRIALQDSTLEINGTSINCTVSIGVAELEGAKIGSLELLLNHSDLALYQAKKSGRNCTLSNID